MAAPTHTQPKKIWSIENAQASACSVCDCSPCACSPEGGRVLSFEAVAEALYAEGYLAHMNPIDHAVVEGVQCHACRGPMACRGFRLVEDDRRVISYRAFAVCSSCGAFFEF